MPSVVAEVTHTDGTTATWRIWYAWPSVYAVYGDERGTWWFSHWFDVAGLRLNGVNDIAPR